MSPQSILLLALSSCLIPSAAAFGQGTSTFTLDFEGPDSFCGGPNWTLVQEYNCRLTSAGNGEGAKAWSVGMKVDGGKILSITTAGTPVDDAEIKVSRITGGAGNEGAFTAVVLAQAEVRVLPPNSTTVIARIRVQGTIPPNASGTATLRYVDGLRPAGSPPFDTKITEGAESLLPVKIDKPIDLLLFGPNCPDVNPAGWVQTAGWNMLFPLGNAWGCDGGGPINMIQNWVAPHSLLAENPVPGERWGDIDFNGAAAATGFVMSDYYAVIDPGLPPVPWVSLAELSAVPGAAPPANLPPNGDVVDFQGLVNFVNTTSLPTLGPYVPVILSDRVLGIAQTYVHNAGTDPFCANVCARSWDSLLVWVNDHLTIIRSGCGPLPPDCSEEAPAVLQPGLNKITVLSWEGIEEWGFGLSFEDASGTKLSNRNQSQIRFLGARPTAGIAPAPQVEASRRIANPDGCPGPAVVKVTIFSNDQGSGDFLITESYLASEITDISTVSHGGVVTTAGGLRTITWNVTTLSLNEGLSYDVTIPPGETAHPIGRLNGCSTVVGSNVIRGPLAHTGPIGAFLDSHDIGTSTDLSEGNGSLTAALGFDGLAGTPDDVYTMLGSGKDVGDGGDSFHFAYRRMSGDFEVVVRVQSRQFPATGGRRARYGLMARLDCWPNSKYSLLAANLEADLGPAPGRPRGDAVFWQFRRNNRVDGTTDSTQFVIFPDPDGNGPEIENQPNYFRLRRRGETLTGYASFDGQNWKLVGSDTWYGLAPDAELMIGCMCSKDASAPQAVVGYTDFAIGALPRAEVFDNDAGTPANVIYQNNFNSNLKGVLPPDLQVNCGANCEAGGFTPRVVNGRLRLTQEGVKQNATSVFFKDLLLPTTSGKIIIEYTVFVTHSGLLQQPPAGDPNPGDGLTMTLTAGTDVSRVGKPGAGLGYSGIGQNGFRSAGPSFAVEYDCWTSAASYNEGAGSPSADGNWHLGIDASGNTHSLAKLDSGLANIYDPRGIRQRVEVTSDGKITVFDVTPGGGGADGKSVLESQGEPLSSQGDGQSALGFTGSTGDGSQTAEIDDVVVSVQDCSDASEMAVVSGPTSARPGQAVRLDAGGSSAGTGDASETINFQWQVLSGGDKGSLQIDASGSGATFQVTLNAEDGEVIIGVVADDLHCEVPPSATATHRIQVRTANWTTFDANADGTMDISDAITDLTYQFVGGSEPSCLEALDYNGDEVHDISDPIGALGYLFLGGPESPRGVGCQGFPKCGAGCQ